MKFFLPQALLAASVARAFTYERLDKNDTLLLILGQQEGLYQLARDFDPAVFRNSMYAHAEPGRVFFLPVVLSSSAGTGAQRAAAGRVPNRGLPGRRGRAHHDGRVRHVPGPVPLREAGYAVWANVEASGTTAAALVRDASSDRVRAASVHVVSYFDIVCELMRDWRDAPGAAEIYPVLDKYYPVYGALARAHRAAVQDGTIVPGEAALPWAGGSMATMKEWVRRGWEIWISGFPISGGGRYPHEALLRADPGR
ncbi:hypothetical protein LQW54_007334 [Pestalotiopsis sp. IQ-011]